MSAPFFKVSLPANVEQYRELQRAAKARGFSLTVRNRSPIRGVRVFLFYLDRKDSERPVSFSGLDEAAVAVEASS